MKEDTPQKEEDAKEEGAAEEEEEQEEEEEAAAAEEEEEEEVKKDSGGGGAAVVKKQKVDHNAPKKPLSDKEAEQAIAEFMERVSRIRGGQIFIVKSAILSPKYTRSLPVKSEESCMLENHG